MCRQVAQRKSKALNRKESQRRSEESCGDEWTRIAMERNCDETARIAMEKRGEARICDGNAQWRYDWLRKSGAMHRMAMEWTGIYTWGSAKNWTSTAMQCNGMVMNSEESKCNGMDGLCVVMSSSGAEVQDENR